MDQVKLRLKREHGHGTGSGREGGRGSAHRSDSLDDGDFFVPIEVSVHSFLHSSNQVLGNV